MEVADHVASVDPTQRHRFVEEMRGRWPGFLARRHEHLQAYASGRTPSRRTTENILRDLLTTVLDWSAHQVRLQDSGSLLLSRLGAKYLVVEIKEPGSLDGPGKVSRALWPAVRQAESLKARRVAVTDGDLFDAHDLDATGMSPRVRLHLSDPAPPDDLWWLSTRGIPRTVR
jgi:hypothetical protein